MRLSPQGAEQLLPHRMLGRTGRSVGILGLGGGGVFFKKENRDLAVQVLDRGIDLGINYLDTAPSYGDSEELFGEVIENRRDEVFLATKVRHRTYDEAWDSITRSLERLRTDHIDLLQIHDVENREQVDRVMEQDGALQAILEARAQNLVRWIGITGHTDPEALLYGLERFDFDTVLMPVNVTDRHYLSFIDDVLPVALERGMGVIGMKVYCAGGVFETLDLTPEEALRYALSSPVSTAIVGVESLDQLLQNLDIARRFVPMTEDEQEAILGRTRGKAAVCSSKFKRTP